MILVTPDDQLLDELWQCVKNSGIKCDIDRARTFAGAELIAETVRPAKFLIDQELARNEPDRFTVLRRRVADRAVFVGIGGNANWAAHEGIDQLLPRPLNDRQVTMAIEPERLKRPDIGRVPTPSAPASNIEGLLIQASDLVGHLATVQMVRQFNAARTDPRRWHPWAPAFEWMRRPEPRGPIPPYVTALARDMTFLRAMPKVLEGRLRERVRDRLLAEGDATVQEIIIAGGSITLGYEAEWTAITGNDTADVLIHKPGPLEVQVKTRRRMDGDPMERLTYLYRRIRDAADQMTRDRIGVVVLVVPGAPDWSKWRDTVVGREFLIYVRDVLFREARFARVPLSVFASGALAAGGGSSHSIYQSGWVLQNVATCELSLPDGLALFTDAPKGPHEILPPAL
jgi:hypothetical protein